MVIISYSTEVWSNNITELLNINVLLYYIDVLVCRSWGYIRTRKNMRYFSLFIFSITSGSPNSHEGILDTEAGPDIGDMDQFTEEEFRYNILY